jgi:hypothetical protein
MSCARSSIHARFKLPVLIRFEKLARRLGPLQPPHEAGFGNGCKRGPTRRGLSAHRLSLAHSMLLLKQAHAKVRQRFFRSTQLRVRFSRFSTRDHNSPESFRCITSRQMIFRLGQFLSRFPSVTPNYENFSTPEPSQAHRARINNPESSLADLGTAASCPKNPCRYGLAQQKG